MNTAVNKDAEFFDLHFSRQVENVNKKGQLILAYDGVLNSETIARLESDIEGKTGLEYRSSMDAIAHGTEGGLKIYLQIIAMLIVTIALVALANSILHLLPLLAVGLRAIDIFHEHA